MGLTTYGNYNIEDTASFTVYVPKTEECFATSLAVIPLQLMGYYVSVAKGLDVDKPRNLAKERYSRVNLQQSYECGEQKRQMFFGEKQQDEVIKMGKYFGTDGFRGEANENPTADHAYKVGRFLGWYYGELKRQNGDDTPARIIIGKDTRRSSYMFEYTLVGGLVASGADAYLLHVTTTPSVAYVARVDEFDCGIMISASHNPYFDNGIKLINGNGEKMDEETISLVEAYLDGNLEVFGQKWEEIPFCKEGKNRLYSRLCFRKKPLHRVSDLSGRLFLPRYEGGAGLCQWKLLEHCQGCFLTLSAPKPT